mmetsp:Transcript_2896/g.4403  ORF Transcript_2896/g.4403 Transcript_2896/m.4403 type:complete len:113 (+) Transcript_2896:100-438(+)|eukprot:CAMPEP_0184655356 /NCGR_PEP_ID=MMETSP0308-20130426/12963_1 /TAXON_ID=38269 /ORGANISM="Gloeochaete witrockiana, Strain SAG 46.84" /LENGTH=112 /DNA_ID=CAMNT_0027091771 /DNA_START=110 /DNA_END=448 /DNA_ORIENTATION=+
MAFVTSFAGAKLGSTSFFNKTEETAACPQNATNMTMNWANFNPKSFKVSVVYPARKSGYARTQSDALYSTTCYTKTIPFDSWFADQQAIQKSGGKIIKVRLATGNPRLSVNL